MLHINDELTVTGNYGKYQQLLLWLVLLPTQLPYGSHLYCHLLSAWTPDHWCVVSRISEQDSYLYYSIRKTMAKEYRNTGYLYSQCFVNRTLNTMVIKEHRLNPRKKLMRFHSQPAIRKCEEGWIYNRSWIKDGNTIVTEVIIMYYIFFNHNILKSSPFI